MWCLCRGWLDTAACRITGASAHRRHGASQSMVRGLGGLLDRDPAYREFRRGQSPPSPHPNPVGSTALPSTASTVAMHQKIHRCPWLPERRLNLFTRMALALLVFAGMSFCLGSCVLCNDVTGCSNLDAIRQRCDDACWGEATSAGSVGLSCEACQKAQQGSWESD
jgi:hypothetical protein